MKKKIIVLIIAILVVVGLLFVFTNKDEKQPANINKETNKSETVKDKVDKIMSGMTIDEKIAQMLILYYTKDTVDENLIDILKNTKPGGFIIMKDNITTFDKTKKFIDDLKSNSELPLIISIDQEGGAVQRLQYLTDVKPTYIPDMYSLGSTNNKELAYNVGKVMADELKTLGINVDYAPVLDIYSNPNNKVIGRRSFGTSKEVVSSMALSLARGLEDNGIIPTYKHFPGHGDTEVDSHQDLPVINKTYDELKENELVPFKEAIDNGAKIMMIGHLLFPSVSSEPTSLSKEVITDILKKDLGFKGLVITDALNMGALTKNYTEEEIYTKAINAGVDLLLMPNGSKKAIEYIKKNISEDRIDESVRKILEFKLTSLKDYEVLDKSYLNNEEGQNIIKQIPVSD